MKARPKFTSRKKREKNAAIKLVLDSMGPQAEPLVVEPPRQQSQSDPHIPEWRLQQEQSEPADAPSVPQTSWTKSLDAMTERDWRIVRRDLEVQCADPIWPLRSWADLGPKMPQNMPFKEPTAIQACAIPLLNAKKDVVGVAPTGSGKTLAFCVPAPKSRCSSLVLAPTRELALQTCSTFQDLNLKVAAVIGGREYEDQQRDLESAQAIVATPGRLVDFLEEGLDLASVTYYVCDEADRMLDMGFEDDLRKITKSLSRPQTVMFTATWNPEIEKLASALLNSPTIVKIGTTMNAKIKQEFKWTENKLGDALAIISTLPKPCIIFCNTKLECDKLEEQAPQSVAIHSSKSQAVREKALESYKRGRFNTLIATDVIGRGIDIKGVASVLNYDMPKEVDTYIHRVGRTGRADRPGYALSLLEAADKPILNDLRKAMRASRMPTASLDALG